MGTRSLTFVYDDLKAPLVCLYRQYDGYPSGHGMELAEFLETFDAVTNGIRVGDTRKIANGMGCLAAQLIAHFKTEAGGFYIYPTSAKDVGEEYVYHIYKDSVVIEEVGGGVIFDASWDDLYAELMSVEM